MTLTYNNLIQFSHLTSSAIVVANETVIYINGKMKLNEIKLKINFSNIIEIYIIFPSLVAQRLLYLIYLNVTG